jgi:hypothetical protein
MLPTRARRRQTVENEQRTYGIPEWVATLRARRTEEELAAVAAGIRERQAARRSLPQEPEFHSRLPAAPVPEAGWGVATYRADLDPTA